MDNSGAIIGPLLASLLLFIFPLKYGYIFILATVPAVLGVITILLFIKEKKERILSNNNKISFRQLPRKFYFFLFIIFIFSLGNSTDALLLVKTSETGIKPAYVPFIYMLFNTVSVFLAVPSGKLSDKIGREKLIVTGFFIYALVYFLFGAFNHIGVFVFAFILYGIYSAFTDSCQKALISDLTGIEIKGTGFGIYHAILGITLLPASLIAGLLYDKVNAGAPFFFGSMMSLLAAILLILYMLCFRNK
jgi:MFS family permease